MADHLANLRPICTALVSSDFLPLDRLKSILQVACELLHASSIVAYKYDRVTEQLEIFGMPGVTYREVMRGPTPEPVFVWEDEFPEFQKQPRGAWLKNKVAFDQFINKAKAVRGIGTDQVRPLGWKSFRDRELEKYGGKGDLATAKLCLYKGVGQTCDRVGQLFFNFYVADPNEDIFENDDDLRIAILFVGTVVRELLIQELYHEQIAETKGDSLSDILHLLRLMDDKLRTHVAMSLDSYRRFSRDFKELLSEMLAMRIERLANPLAVVKRGGHEACKSMHANLLPEAQAILSEVRRVFNQFEHGEDYAASEKVPLTEVRRAYTGLVEDALSIDMWRLVCRAALSSVETYGGIADIILNMGKGICRRILPSDPRSTVQEDIFWLHKRSISAHCIETSKVFVCNNVQEKATDEFKERFEHEHKVGDYKSLMVVPIEVDGEVRALLRLMSADKNCFLDRHTRAAQHNAFVAGYCFRMLDYRWTRERISHGLQFFAQRQAVAEHCSVEELLREAIQVLKAEYAVFWSADAAASSSLPFRTGIRVAAAANVPTDWLLSQGPEEPVRRDGMTNRIFETSSHKSDVLLFCLHVLSELAQADRPEYVAECLAPTGDSSITPWTPENLSLSKSTCQHMHTQVGFAVQEMGALDVQLYPKGVAWICFPNLHRLGWWEKLYIRGLSNYLAQALKATGLRLAVRSFYHMIPSVASETLWSLKSAGSVPGHPVVGVGKRDDIETARRKGEDVMFMTRSKACEVRRLLYPYDPQLGFADLKVGEMLRRAWAIADDLQSRSNVYDKVDVNGFEADLLGDLCIVYGPGIRRSTAIPGVFYTVAVNILQNSRFYGKKPFVVWVCDKDGRSTLVFADHGSVQPKESPSGQRVSSILNIPESAMMFDSPGHGVGLPLVRRLLQLEGGDIQLLERNDFEKRYRSVPERMKSCTTFFEVRL